MSAARRCRFSACVCWVMWWSVASVGGAEPAAAPADKLEYLPFPSAAEQRIQASLQQPTELQFADVALSDALEFFRDVHQAPIWVDVAALSDAGVDLSAPVTLDLKGVSLRSALRLLLEPLQLTAVIEDEVLKITTAANAQKALRTRVYPVSDLAGSEEDLKALATALERGVKATWAPAAGAAANTGSVLAGTITPVLRSRALVIRCAPGVHEEVLELLRSLRAAQQLSAAAPAAP